MKIIKAFWEGGLINYVRLEDRNARAAQMHFRVAKYTSVGSVKQS